MAGPAAAASAVVGLVVGHGWWWGVFGGPRGRSGSVLERWGKAPAWVKSFVGNGGGVGVRVPRATATATATASGYRWGSGRRLGE